MNLGFWGQLKKPIIALAPLDDVTDAAFRELIAGIAKPDIMYTEFTSADGLVTEGYERLQHDLKYTEGERPIIVQLFGANPKNFYECAKMAAEKGFDGIDINMGCPDKAVCKGNAGAALIENPQLAQEIIRETIRGAGDLPVSVKTRVGYNEEKIEEWCGQLLEAEPASITFHLRTKKQMSKVPADWNLIEKAIAVRDKSGSETLILGNGDVVSVEHAKELCIKHGADGAMLGRAIFGNPWLFHPEKDKTNVSLKEKLETLRTHVLLYDKHLGGIKSFMYMKKHFKSYADGFVGAKAYRAKLMDASTADEVVKIINEKLETL